MDVLIEESDPSVAETIESELLKALRSTLVQSENSNFVLSAKNAQNSLIGGLTASTSYGWVLIKVLWVDDAQRRKGVGRMLMEKAEIKGKSIGCHSVWLETSNPDAKGFYEALGYEVFGRLSNEAGQFPESHERWFMKKELDRAVTDGCCHTRSSL
ncbi:MAG: GNAT family N-acetyltransferase [Woeseiaceae bacterium]|nr:GNAT family N-acetyltransferase [Woeseiaceae bacterium]